MRVVNRWLITTICLESSLIASVIIRKWKDIPIGTYTGYNCYLKLRENDLVMQNLRNPEYVTPYDLITELKFIGAGLFGGSLTIRWKENSHIPFPKSYFQAKKMKQYL